MDHTRFKLRVAITLTCLLIGAGLFSVAHQTLLASTSPHQPRSTSDKAARPASQIGAADIQIVLEPIVSGFNRPVQVTHAGDGSGRLFVVEQDGRIKVVKNGAVLTTPFLDINGLVKSPSDNGGNEQGLLGLAFHPDYQNNDFFYINYTDNNGDTVIARYSVSASDPDVADSGRAVPLLTVNQPYRNHNGGQLLFSPIDGYLYVGMGDGGSGGDPHNNGQNINTLLGAMLRLDVDDGTPYAIPPDNPYATTAGADEIWAIGLRNPWRFSFDRATGDLYIGDVGQNEWEEISYQAANTTSGVNFGWRCREGAHDYNFSGDCASQTLTDPIAEYNHTEGNAVTGGFVYRGSLYPALRGHYFFADYGTGKIWSIYQTGSNSWSNRELLFDADFPIPAFGEDEAGEVYVAGFDGTIYRLADANGSSPNLSSSTKTASPPHANPDETVTYTIELKNTGSLSNETATLTDTLPANLTYVDGTLTASHGIVTDTNPSLLRWQGSLDQETVTITYQAKPGDVQGSLINTARLTAPGLEPVTLSTALFVPRPPLGTTLNDFFLPGTQPNQLADTIVNPNGCNFCHTAPIYDKWRGSMMAQSGRDPLLWAALAVANADAPNAGEYCLRCHTPKGWLEGRSRPGDGSALRSEDIQAGVACEICHRMVDPVPSTSDEAVEIDQAIRSNLADPPPASHPANAMLIVDPKDNRRGPFAFDPDPPHPQLTLRTDFLGQSGNPVTESRLCGTCHNVDNPALSWNDGRSQFWPNDVDLAAPSFGTGDLFPIETTFDEWANSQYAAGGVYAPALAGSKPDGIVQSCQDCHLRRTTGQAADDLYNPVTRNCTTTGCLPEHDLVGGNTWVPLILQDSRWRLNSAGESAYLNGTILRARDMLQKAATLSVTLTTGPDKVATVRVTNETGHKLPTGYPEGRRMWLNLKAYDGNGTLIYEAGSYNPATGDLDSTGTKIYEAKQGLTGELATELNQILGRDVYRPGPTFHFILNNIVIKDNRIPPRGYTQAAFDRPGLEPVGTTYADGHYWDDTAYSVPEATERVVATLYYQTASKEYIDFLRSKGGLDGATLGTLWDTSKSPPEIMAVAYDPPLPIYMPLIFKNGSN